MAVGGSFGAFFPALLDNSPTRSRQSWAKTGPIHVRPESWTRRWSSWVKSLLRIIVMLLGAAAAVDGAAEGGVHRDLIK